MTAMPRAETIEATSLSALETPSRPPRIVIIGAGFGGLTAAAGLAKAEASVTVIDRRNYHLFQPLLYQVATAALNPSDTRMIMRSPSSRSRSTWRQARSALPISVSS